eukprot:4172310-Prymnesium_polylepis.1
MAAAALRPFVYPEQDGKAKHVDLASFRDHAGLQEGYAARRDVLCVFILQIDEVSRKIDGLAIPC